MKKLIALLLIFAMVLPVLVSCENNKPSADTTVAQTEPEKEPEGRKSKAYPNSLKVSAYNLLTDSEILLYEAVAKLIAAPEPAKSITLKYGVRTDSFNMIIDIFRANFATHASVIESISYTEADGKITSVMLSEDFDKAAFESEYKTVSKKADEIISSIPLGLSDKEIVFELVDYLVKNTTYTDESETTSVHTALLEGRADSEGFAKALDLLLDRESGGGNRTGSCLSFYRSRDRSSGRLYCSRSGSENGSSPGGADHAGHALQYAGLSCGLVRIPL